jgi:hypothetical protein
VGNRLAVGTQRLSSYVFYLPPRIFLRLRLDRNPSWGLKDNEHRWACKIVLKSKSMVFESKINNDPTEKLNPTRFGPLNIALKTK